MQTNLEQKETKATKRDNQASRGGQTPNCPNSISIGKHSTPAGITRFTPAIHDAIFGKLLFCAPLAVILALSRVIEFKPLMPGLGDQQPVEGIAVVM